MYDDVLGIAFGGVGGAGAAMAGTDVLGTGALLAQTGNEIGQLLIVAWGLALAGTSIIAGTARFRARKQQS